MTRLAFAVCAGVTLALTGCGGGGGGSSAPAPSQPPATTSLPLVTPAPGPGTYAVTEIVPLPGDDFTDASGLNSSGQVVGRSSHAEGAGCPSGGACPAGSTLVAHLYFFDGSTIASLNGWSGYIPAADWVNDQGVVAGGTVASPGSLDTAALFHGGAATLIGALAGDDESYATAVNDQGQAAVVSNHYNNGNRVSRAALYQNGTLTALAPLAPGQSSAADAINGSGQVAGICAIDASLDHAVLWSGGQPTDLGLLPGADYSYASALNDSGQVVGASGTNGPGDHAFLYSTGTMTDLGTLPGGQSSEASGINQAGVVVGKSESSATPSAAPFHAVLWRSGQVVDLNTLIAHNSGWVLTSATGINDAGQVCGNGTYQGQQVAFLLTPH